MSSQKNILSPNKIHHGNCVELLKTIPDQSIDLVFADPPYNLQLKGDLHRPNDTKVDGVQDDWDQFDSFKAYDDFSKSWLEQCRRVLKPNGSLWVIGSYHNIFRCGAIIQNLGYWILNDVIWRKTNPMPNFRGRRFTNAHETLIWAAHSEKSKYTFNYDSMKALNEDLQMRSDWTLPICSGGERIKNNTGQKAHPTQKPEALLYRIILASTRPNDIVLDPFFGTGTTGAVAKLLGRQYIGFEMEKSYIEIAQKRIEQTQPIQKDMVFNLVSKRDQPRIPFGTLVEQGYLKVGTTLVDLRKKHKATVTADGNLRAQSDYGHHHGSIHKVGAELQGRPSCNGWTYWHVQKGQKVIPIDEYRQQIRSNLQS